MAMHGGPESQARLGWKGRTNYLAEQLGVAVLEPNVRGSSGYGKTFLDLDNGRLREDSVKDMAAAIDWISTQPALDVHRVLVMGSSHGGYMALAASTLLADRIAGAVSVGGISNFVSFLETTESDRRDLRRAEYGDERDPAMRSFLHAISPLTHAERISKPLLVVQGKERSACALDGERADRAQPAAAWPASLVPAGPQRGPRFRAARERELLLCRHGALHRQDAQALTAPAGPPSCRFSRECTQ
jgi:dipeptidyl aminopeptidase/acylaminoacyl peptidase